MLDSWFAELSFSQCQLEVVGLGYGLDANRPGIVLQNQEGAVSETASVQNWSGKKK